MRSQVQSPASLSGLRIGIAVSCGVGCRRSSEPELLWLWCKLAAVALIRPLAWESPYAAGAALKSNKKKKSTIIKNTYTSFLLLPSFIEKIQKSFCFSQWLYLRHMEVPGLGFQPARATPTATATLGLSHIFDLRHSLRQRQILNPVSKARDRPCLLTDIVSGS